MRAATLIFVTVVAAAGAQSPQLQNAKLTSQPVTSLARDVAAAAARATDPAVASWVAWQVPMIDGERNLCCFYSDDSMANGVRGCWMEPADPNADPAARRGAPKITAPTGAVPLEGGTQLTIYVRLIDKRIERLRVLDDACPVDAGGRAVQWLTGVSGADSVAWLKSLALDDKMDADVRSSLATAAVRALALHRDPSAVTTLIEIARITPTTPTATSIRRQAMTGLGQSRDPRALQFLQGIITK
jgi:hypothetical protein